MEFGKGLARISEQKMERGNLYQKRLGSMNKRVSIICGLGQMARTECNTTLYNILSI